MKTIKRFNWEGRIVQFFELTIDLSLLVVGFWLAIYIKQNNFLSVIFKFENIHIYIREYISIILTNILFLVITLILFRVYKTTLTKKSYYSVMISVLFSLILSNVIVFIFEGLSTRKINLTTFIITIYLQFFLIALFKFVLWKIMKKFNTKYAIIVGPKKECEAFAKEFLTDDKHYMKLKHILVLEREDIFDDEYFDYINTCKKVFLTKSLSEEHKNIILTYCLSKDYINCYLIPKVYEIGLKNSSVQHFDDILSFQVTSLHLSLEQQIVKRSFDILVSLVLLMLFSPILIITSLAIKLYDKGPVFYKQQRITRYGEKFDIFKFRTMIIDAEKETGPIQAAHNDARITKVGAFLRKTRIDELPQLFLVLSGKMSMVGPRPLRVEEVEEYTKADADFAFRKNVKAGLTGLAQASASYSVGFEDKLKFDLLYIRDYSFFEDIKIMFLTFRTVFDKGMSKGVCDELKFEEFISSKKISSENECNIITLKCK